MLFTPSHVLAFSDLAETFYFPGLCATAPSLRSLTCGVSSNLTDFCLSGSISSHHPFRRIYFEYLIQSATKFGYSFKYSYGNLLELASQYQSSRFSINIPLSIDLNHETCDSRPLCWNAVFIFQMVNLSSKFHVIQHFSALFLLTSVW